MLKLITNNSVTLIYGYYYPYQEAAKLVIGQNKNKEEAESCYHGINILKDSHDSDDKYHNIQFLWSSKEIQAQSSSNTLEVFMGEWVHGTLLTLYNTLVDYTGRD